MSFTAFVMRTHGLNGLEAEERERPALQSGDVVLRMRAASLNYRDLEIVLGCFHTPFKLPLVPLSDGVGEVIAIGPGVSRVKVGDRAVMAFWENWHDGRFQSNEVGVPLGGPKDGVLAQEFVTHEQRLVVVPETLSDVEAASLPCAATTAWHSLMVAGNLQPGQTVLVQGTGGVSLFALQFALMAGAKVIVTSSSDAKIEQVLGLGASAGINYVQNPDWAAEVLRLTDGRGVDHVIEVGGPSTFNQSLRAIRSTGQINVIGYLGGNEGNVNPLDIFRRQATVRGIPVGSRQMLADAVAAYAGSAIRPVIDRCFNWRAVADAFQHLQSGRHFGKVVLQIAD